MALYDYITSEGVIVPKTSDILSEVQSEWLKIFPSMNLDASTPQGRIIELIAQYRKEEIGLAALLANQINPQYATGERLDSIAGLFYVTRRGATSTIVNAVLGGKPLTYSTAKIKFSESGISDGDVITINNDINFVYGVDIEIGSDIQTTISNTVAAINADADLGVLMTASIEDEGMSILLTSKYLASISTGKFYDITISYDTESETETPNEISTTKGYTYIPAGSLVSDESNNIYVLSDSVMLDTNGQANGYFSCQTTGEVPCPPNSIKTIISTIEGWETVYNPSAGTAGSEQESDESLYRRYNASKTKYSAGYVQSIEGALYDIDGVKSVYVYENDTSLPKTHDNDSLIPTGETVLPHSVFIVVDGGNQTGNFDEQVAEAIMNKKSAGCGMSPANEDLTPHATSHSVSIPMPNGGIFTAVYNTPALIPIYISMSVSNGSYSGYNHQADIKNLLVQWGAGNYSGEDGVKIGTPISAFEVSCIVQRNLGASVKDCKIGTSMESLGYSEIPIQITQKAVFYDTNIVVNVE